MNNPNTPNNTSPLVEIKSNTIKKAAATAVVMSSYFACEVIANRPNDLPKFIINIAIIVTSRLNMEQTTVAAASATGYAVINLAAAWATETNGYSRQ